MKQRAELALVREREKKDAEKKDAGEKEAW